MTQFDVVTLGETMLRLTPPSLLRWEQAAVFEVHVGGSESNTAVGLSRLGLRVSWLSRLTDNPLGRIITQTLAQHGVDTSHVVWTTDDRVGLYFLEEGKAPRGSQVVYDRRHSAMANMQPSDLSESFFQRDCARLLHTTGISVAISESAAATTLRSVELAKRAHWLVSFDVNYRRKLWTPEQARIACDPFLQQADLIFMPLRDARSLFAIADDVPAEEVLRRIGRMYLHATVIFTMGSEGAIAQAGTKQHRQPAFPAEPVGRLGGGDAFSAGFLASYLENPDIAQSLRWGAASAALKYSISGDLPLISRQEVLAVMAQDMAAEIRR